MKKGNDLGRDSVFPLVLRLAVPTMLAQLVSVLYSIVDRMYIGNIPQVGDLALAGVGVCGPIVTLITSFATLVGLGGSPLLAMRMGEGNRERAQQVLNNCFVMLTVLSVVLTVAVLLLKEKLLWWFGISAATFPYANTYLTIYTWGTFFALMASGMNNFLIAQGFSGLGMGTVMLGAGLNLVLDPIFIFGLDSCALVLFLLRSKRMPIRLGVRGWDWEVCRRVLSFGLTPFLIIGMDSVLLIALNTGLQRYGGEGLGDTLVTCATIAQSFMLVVTMPLGGITGGTECILSFNYGARN